MTDAKEVRRAEVMLEHKKWKDVGRGYESALRVCGAEVLAFKEFGSYQGAWLALVRWQGQRGYVVGSYGSCSGCDAFESEFGYVEDEDSNEPVLKLLEFGWSYLEALQSKDEVVAQFQKDTEFDSEAELIIKWVNSHKEKS